MAATTELWVCLGLVMLAALGHCSSNITRQSRDVSSIGYSSGGPDSPGSDDSVGNISIDTNGRPEGTDSAAGGSGRPGGTKGSNDGFVIAIAKVGSKDISDSSRPNEGYPKIGPEAQNIKSDASDKPRISDGSENIRNPSGNQEVLNNDSKRTGISAGKTEIVTGNPGYQSGVQGGTSTYINRDAAGFPRGTSNSFGEGNGFSKNIKGSTNFNSGSKGYETVNGKEDFSGYPRERPETSGTAKVKSGKVEQSRGGPISEILGIANVISENLYSRGPLSTAETSGTTNLISGNVGYLRGGPISTAETSGTANIISGNGGYSKAVSSTAPRTNEFTNAYFNVGFEAARGSTGATNRNDGAVEYYTGGTQVTGSNDRSSNGMSRTTYGDGRNDGYAKDNLGGTASYVGLGGYQNGLSGAPNKYGSGVSNSNSGTEGYPSVTNGYSGTGSYPSGGSGAINVIGGTEGYSRGILGSTNGIDGTQGYPNDRVTLIGISASPGEIGTSNGNFGVVYASNTNTGGYSKETFMQPKVISENIGHLSGGNIRSSNDITGPGGYPNAGLATVTKSGDTVGSVRGTIGSNNGNSRTGYQNVGQAVNSNNGAVYQNSVFGASVFNSGSSGYPSANAGAVNGNKEFVGHQSGSSEAANSGPGGYPRVGLGTINGNSGTNKKTGISSGESNFNVGMGGYPSGSPGNANVNSLIKGGYERGSTIESNGNGGSGRYMNGGTGGSNSNSGVSGFPNDNGGSGRYMNGGTGGSNNNNGVSGFPNGNGGSGRYINGGTGDTNGNSGVSGIRNDNDGSGRYMNGGTGGSNGNSGVSGIPNGNGGSGRYMNGGTGGTNGNSGVSGSPNGKGGSGRYMNGGSGGSNSNNGVSGVPIGNGGPGGYANGGSGIATANGGSGGYANGGMGVAKGNGGAGGYANGGPGIANSNGGAGGNANGGPGIAMGNGGAGGYANGGPGIANAIGGPGGYASGGSGNGIGGGGGYLNGGPGLINGNSGATGYPRGNLQNSNSNGGIGEMNGYKSSGSSGNCGYSGNGNGIGGMISGPSSRTACNIPEATIMTSPSSDRISAMYVTPTSFSQVGSNTSPLSQGDGRFGSSNSILATYGKKVNTDEYGRVGDETFSFNFPKDARGFGSNDSPLSYDTSGTTAGFGSTRNPSSYGIPRAVETTRELDFNGSPSAPYNLLDTSGKMREFISPSPLYSSQGATEGREVGTSGKPSALYGVMGVVGNTDNSAFNSNQFYDMLEAFMTSEGFRASNSPLAQYGTPGARDDISNPSVSYNTLGYPSERDGFLGGPSTLYGTPQSSGGTWSSLGYYGTQGTGQFGSSMPLTPSGTVIAGLTNSPSQAFGTGSGSGRVGSFDTSGFPSTNTILESRALGGSNSPYGTQSGTVNRPSITYGVTDDSYGRSEGFRKPGVISSYGSPEAGLGIERNSANLPTSYGIPEAFSTQTNYR